jgi:hypothetical protein
MNEKLKAMREAVDDLFWDYDRMSSSGKETLDKLASLVETDREGEQK